MSKITAPNETPQTPDDEAGEVAETADRADAAPETDNSLAVDAPPAPADTAPASPMASLPDSPQGAGQLTGQGAGTPSTSHAVSQAVVIAPHDAATISHSLEALATGKARIAAD